MSQAREFEPSAATRMPVPNLSEPPAKKIASTEAPVPAYYHNFSPYRVVGAPALQAGAEMSFSRPAMSVRVVSPAVTNGEDDVGVVKECLPTLMRWDRPDLREKAAVRLGGIDCRQYPEVVDALRSAAVTDAAAGVRIACIRSLAKVGMESMEVMATLEKLKADRDPAVSEAAGDALAKLKDR